MTGTKFIDLSAGQFNIGLTSLNTIYSNVTLQGKGRGVTTLKVAANKIPFYDTYNSAVRVMGGVSNIWLKDFTLDTNMTGIGVAWKGAYDNGTTYAPTDLVYYPSALTVYMCIQATTGGHLPTDPAYWTIWDLRGITTTGVTDLNIVNVGFKGVLKMAICVEGDDEIYLDRCRFEGGMNNHGVQAAYIFQSNQSGNKWASHLFAQRCYFLDGGYNNAGAQAFYCDYGQTYITHCTFKNCDMPVDTRGPYDSGDAQSHLHHILIDGGAPTVDDGQVHYWWALSYSSDGSTADDVYIINWTGANMHHNEVVMIYGGDANSGINNRLSNFTIFSANDTYARGILRFATTASNNTIDKWFAKGTQLADNNAILIGHDGTGAHNTVTRSRFFHAFWGLKLNAASPVFHLYDTDIYDCSGGLLTKSSPLSAIGTMPNLDAKNSLSTGTNGFINAGDIKTFSGILAGGALGIGLSIDNPFGQAVRVLSVDLQITTQSAASGKLCVGIGSSATVDYETMFAQQPTDLGTAYPYLRNSIKTATYGVQTNPINWAYGAGNRYLNFYFHAATTGMVLTYTVTVMGNNNT